MISPTPLMPARNALVWSDTIEVAENMDITLEQISAQLLMQISWQDILDEGGNLIGKIWRRYRYNIKGKRDRTEHPQAVGVIWANCCGELFCCSVWPNPSLGNDMPHVAENRSSRWKAPFVPHVALDRATELYRNGDEQEAKKILDTWAANYEEAMYAKQVFVAP